MIVARRLRAPRRNGAVVAEPPLLAASDLFEHNRERFHRNDTAILGRSLSDMRREARDETIAAAHLYFHQTGEPLPRELPTECLFLAGHQPELFHPGVWVKNFALNRLARTHGATPLNLVIDNDTAKANVIRVPRADGSQVLLVPFDQGQPDVPFEERPVRDEDLFQTFAERVGELTSDWPFRPLLPEFWADVRDQSQRSRLLGERIVAARRTWERRWGCHNLEVPLSRLCATDSFAWFVCHWLADLPRFHQVYNQAVATYRSTYGIRSQNHPVPDLASDGGWLEAPLWAWRADRTRRGRVMVRAAGQKLELRTDLDMCPSITAPGVDAEAAIRDWRRLREEGWKFRSRALTTTLYARLFLADLFIHGIGGGKYDELTDAIIRAFYGFDPPGFMILSATAWLPLPDFAVQPEQCAELARKARDLHWNPQRHLPPVVKSDPEVQALVQEKQGWIDRIPANHAGRQQRFHKLQESTARMRALIRDQEQTLSQELRQCRRRLHANTVLHNREYAFCLFPAERLRPFCEQFLR